MKLYLETVIFLNLVAEADQRIRLTKRVEYMERSASSGVCPMRKDQRRKRSYMMSSPGSKERFKRKLLVNCINIPTERGKKFCTCAMGISQLLKNSDIKHISAHGNRGTPT